MAECPVCGGAAKRPSELIECARCGAFYLSSSAENLLPHYLGNDQYAWLKISHKLRSRNTSDNFVLNSDLLKLWATSELPSPIEQLENLIIYLANNLNDPGEKMSLGKSDLSAIGAKSLEGLAFICSSAKQRGLIECQIVDFIVGSELDIHDAHLSFDGWTYFQELQKGRTDSMQAFMAMKFGDNETDIFYQFIKGAILKTGFSLKRLDEGQPAGLIDDRLRVEIRQAQFLIADLTHHNNGAYWEAGFAEGLGKPVIYTCRKDVFNDKSQGTHFDTNHHLTVIWEASDLEAAAEKLKATVRATLPELAKMTD